MTDETEYCPACKNSGNLSALRLCQINLQLAVYVCKNSNCSYPEGYKCKYVERDILKIIDDDDKTDIKDLTDSKPHLFEADLNDLDKFLKCNLGDDADAEKVIKDLFANTKSDEKVNLSDFDHFDTSSSKKIDFDMNSEAEKVIEDLCKIENDKKDTNLCQEVQILEENNINKIEIDKNILDSNVKSKENEYNIQLTQNIEDLDIRNMEIVLVDDNYTKTVSNSTRNEIVEQETSETVQIDKNPTENNPETLFLNTVEDAFNDNRNVTLNPIKVKMVEKEIKLETKEEKQVLKVLTLKKPDGTLIPVNLKNAKLLRLRKIPNPQIKMYKKQPDTKKKPIEEKKSEETVKEKKILSTFDCIQNIKVPGIQELRKLIYQEKGLEPPKSDSFPSDTNDINVEEHTTDNETTFEDDEIENWINSLA